MWQPSLSSIRLQTRMQLSGRLNKIWTHPRPSRMCSDHTNLNVFFSGFTNIKGSNSKFSNPNYAHEISWRKRMFTQKFSVNFNSKSGVDVSSSSSCHYSSYSRLRKHSMYSNVYLKHTCIKYSLYPSIIFTIYCPAISMQRQDFNNIYIYMELIPWFNIHLFQHHEILPVRDKDCIILQG